ncbi:MAG: thiamine pyrophosphate-binding protein [Alphaproteobacteria bacterium]|nr:thiamine pyrophosphate-binding protein [Alphaproteobacteria bacterium]
MSTYALLADGIARAGIHHAFGVPGSGPTLELIHALEQRGVRFTTTYFEGTAALMAGTIGRLSGRAGVALSIKGPGFANLAQGLAASWFESFPVVALVEAFPANVDWRIRHKGMDHESLARVVAKARVPLGATPDFARLAALAAAEVPGPVVAEFVAGDASGAAPPPGVAAEPAAMAAVAAAERPLVIAGTLAIRRGWGPRLAALKVPVFSTASAKGVVDETLAHAAGVYTGVGLARAPEAALLPEADLVVGLGLRPGEVLATKPFACRAINVDAVPSAAALGFAATTSDSDSIFAALAPKSWEIPRIQLAVGKLRLKMQSGPYQPAHVYDAVDRHFRSHVRAVFDTGYFCTIGEHAWRARRPDWCLMSGNGRYMGTGIPMALGAAFHDATVPTVAFLGDGGIGTHLAELRIAVRNRLPLLVVLITDGGFGSVRTRAIKEGFTQAPLVMEDASWLSNVAAMGMPAVRAEGLQQFTEALAAWQWRDGPAYIEVPFDPDVYQGMVEGLR